MFSISSNTATSNTVYWNTWNSEEQKRILRNRNFVFYLTNLNSHMWLVATYQHSFRQFLKKTLDMYCITFRRKKLPQEIISSRCSYEMMPQSTEWLGTSAQEFKASLGNTVRLCLKKARCGEQACNSNNPSTQEAKVGESKFKVSLDYTVRPCCWKKKPSK
jgi:hypothetical protein